VSITAVPDRTLNFPSGERSTVRVQPSHIKRVSDASERLQPSHIKRVSDASERLMANSPYGEKAMATTP